MAWRIDEYVVRGEIENGTRVRLTGRIWFFGREDPVELELAGNAWRDLAGRRLVFENPEPKPGLPEVFVARQRGVTGDVTASRKVRVPDISVGAARRVPREQEAVFLALGQLDVPRVAQHCERARRD